MTLYDPGIEVLLESARGAKEPTARDRSRNRAALEARLGPLASNGAARLDGNRAVPLGGPAAVPLGSEALRAGQAGALSSALLSSSLLSSSLKWKLLSLGVLTATVGFLVGLGLGREVRESAQSSPLPAARAAVAVAAVVPSEAAAPSDVAAPSAPAVAAAEPESMTSALALRERAPATRARSPAAPRPAAPVPRDTRFSQALRLLERAQRALDAGEAAFAMSLLNDLDAGFPHSMLAEERQLARVLGWCGLGDAARARSVAAGLLDTNASSIYARRLEHSCVR